jgi:hypothetical protein
MILVIRPLIGSNASEHFFIASNSAGSSKKHLVCPLWCNAVYLMRCLVKEELKSFWYQCLVVLFCGRKIAGNLYVNHPQTSSRERYQR